MMGRRVVGAVRHPPVPYLTRWRAVKPGKTIRP
jgi:hypothetical protein